MPVWELVLVWCVENLRDLRPVFGASGVVETREMHTTAYTIQPGVLFSLEVVLVESGPVVRERKIVFDVSFLRVVERVRFAGGARTAISRKCVVAVDRCLNERRSFCCVVLVCELVDVGRL